MRIMTNLEYAEIVSELQPLVGKRFDKIFKVPEGYRLKIGNVHIIIQPGVRLHPTKYIEEAESPDQFAQKVRAELDNSKLLAVRQVNKDRIVEFEFSRGSLIFEMFAKGNCILVKEGTTVATMREEIWADREIKRRVEYRFPKPSIAKSFRDAISEKYVIISLLKLPLGKEYAQEILARCKIPEKTPGIELSGKQMECIESEIERTFAETSPHLFMKNEKPVDFGLARFSKYAELEITEPKTFSEAPDQFYWLAKEVKVPELAKLERRLEEQEKRLDELKNDASRLKETGDYLYSNYERFVKILDQAKSIPINELENRLKKYNVKVNKKEKWIDLEF